MSRTAALDPSAYWFRILAYDEQPTDDFGSRQVTLGPILWEEPVGREIAWQLKHRVCSAGDEAARIVKRDRRHVMVGYVLIEDPKASFHGDYVVRNEKGVPFWRSAQSEPCIICGAYGEHDPGCMVAQKTSGQRGSIALDCLGMLAPIVACVLIGLTVLLSSIGGAS